MCACVLTSPLPHEGDVDAVRSSDCSERDEAADDGRETLQTRERPPGVRIKSVPTISVCSTEPSDLLKPET